MRMAATMPDLVPSRGLRFLNGAGTDAGATGGRSKCMSGRQLARTGRVGASDNPWDMEQTAKSIRVRNAGEDLRPRPGSALTLLGVGLDHHPCAAKAAYGMPASTTC